MDFVSGTNCKDTASVFDDLQDEAEKHRIEERAQQAARGVFDGLNEGRRGSGSNSEAERDDAGSGQDEAEGADNDDVKDAGDSTRVRSKSESSQGEADASNELAEQAPVKRRSGRRKPRKD